MMNQVEYTWRLLRFLNFVSLVCSCFKVWYNGINFSKKEEDVEEEEEEGVVEEEKKEEEEVKKEVEENGEEG